MDKVLSIAIAISGCAAPAFGTGRAVMGSSPGGGAPGAPSAYQLGVLRAMDGYVTQLQDWSGLELLNGLTAILQSPDLHGHDALPADVFAAVGLGQLVSESSTWERDRIEFEKIRPEDRELPERLAAVVQKARDAAYGSRQSPAAEAFEKALLDLKQDAIARFSAGLDDESLWLTIQNMGLPWGRSPFGDFSLLLERGGGAASPSRLRPSSEAPGLEAQRDVPPPSPASRPEGGIFGPGSMVWRMSNVMQRLKGVWVTSLQNAYPPVAAALWASREIPTKPVDRFAATYRFLGSVFYGDTKTALAALAKIRRMHAYVRGRFRENVGPFQAGAIYEVDSAGLKWVLATLYTSKKMLYEEWRHKLTEAENQRLYAEYRKLGVLLGIDEAQLPAAENWREFEGYFRRMVAEGLWVKSDARNLASWPSRVKPRSRLKALLLAAPLALLKRIVSEWNYGKMPEEVRRLYGIRWNSHRQKMYLRLDGWLSKIMRLLPESWFYSRHYIEARRRLSL